MNAKAGTGPWWRPWFLADWKQFVFIHYAIPPALLAPHTPFRPDCRDGSAFVSLVYFRLENMRLAAGLSGGLTRFLCRPLSDHGFINLRAYVKGPAGPGIQFLTEWVDNGLSAWVGPRLYGLPYRFARLEREHEKATGRWRLMAADENGSGLKVELTDTGEPPTALNDRDAFLVEKYTAYTVRGKTARYFRVGHPPWRLTRVRVDAIDDALIRRTHPWFAHATPISAYAADGFCNVAMGPPCRIDPAACAGRRRSLAWFLD